MRMSQPRAEDAGEASGAGLSRAVPRWLGSPCLCERAGQGWQEQLPPPGGSTGGAGVQVSPGDEQSGRGTCPGDRPSPGSPPQVTRFSHCPAQHDGQPYCHKPCYGILFGPKGECLGVRGAGRRSGSTRPTLRGVSATTQTPRRLPEACHLLAWVLTLLHLLPRRCQHRSCGKLHLRQGPRGEEPALDGVPWPASPPALCPCTNLLLAARAAPCQAGHRAVHSLLSLLRAGQPCPPGYIS